jgi:hypothetical protein
MDVFPKIANNTTVIPIVHQKGNLQKGLNCSTVAGQNKTNDA